jgi:IncFII RepA protein family.
VTDNKPRQHSGSSRRTQNLRPQFAVPEGKGTLAFCRKLMGKAEGFTSRFDFLMHVAFARSIHKRRRKPPEDRRQAIDALLQGLCFHYDPLAGRVQCTVTTLAIECGLATEKKTLAICRASRALKSLADEFGLITYTTAFSPEIGCNIPSDITFTPALFEALDVSPESVAAARRSRAEWENKQRVKRGEERLDTDTLTSRAFGFLRDRFREYHRERRLQGLKRRRAERDAERSRQEIETLVRRELTREVAGQRFPADRQAILHEVARRVKERMMMSRGNHTRLALP